jgi:negative regulator of replication initiation
LDRDWDKLRRWLIRERLEGQSARANLLLSLYNMVSTEHKTNSNRVLSLKGRKRPYFSRNQNDLRAPERVQGTDISVETNLNANSIVSLCQDVLSMFGYKNALKIETD